MYEFLYKTVVYASKREESKTVEIESVTSKTSMKRKQGGPANRAFVLNASRNCITCKNKRHPLYLCDKFKLLSVLNRIEAVRNGKLCYNCLRSHRDRLCKFSNCTICQKRHNTLLHLEEHSTKSNVAKSRTIPSA